MLESIIIVFTVLFTGIFIVVRLARIQKKLRLALNSAEKRNDVCIMKNEQDKLLTRTGYAFRNMDAAQFFNITVEPGLYTVLLPKGYRLVSTNQYLTLDHEGNFPLTIINNNGQFLHTFIRVRMPLMKKINIAIDDWQYERDSRDE